MLKVSLGNRSHLLALPFQVLAVEPIIETPGVVALRVALPVVEVPPALQRVGAVLPRVLVVERAVAVVPAAGVVVAAHVAVLVVLALLALRDLAGHLHLGRRRDVVAEPPHEFVVQDVAAEAVEVGRADALVVRRLGDVLARAAVVAGVGVAGRVGGILALGPREGRRAQTLGALVAGDAGASISAVEVAAGLGVVLTRGAGKTLKEENKKHVKFGK